MLQLWVAKIFVTRNIMFALILFLLIIAEAILKTLLNGLDNYILPEIYIFEYTRLMCSSSLDFLFSLLLELLTNKKLIYWLYACMGSVVLTKETETNTVT